MKLSPGQIEIISLFNNNPEKIMSLTQITDWVGDQYENNAAFYVGLRCGRMVKRKLLERVKKGHYRLYDAQRQETIEQERKKDGYQINLFS